MKIHQLLILVAIILCAHRIDGAAATYLALAALIGGVIFAINGK